MHVYICLKKHIDVASPLEKVTLTLSHPVVAMVMPRTDGFEWSGDRGAMRRFISAGYEVSTSPLVGSSLHQFVSSSAVVESHELTGTTVVGLSGTNVGSATLLSFS